MSHLVRHNQAWQLLYTDIRTTRNLVKDRNCMLQLVLTSPPPPSDARFCVMACCIAVHTPQDLKSSLSPGTLQREISRVVEENVGNVIVFQQRFTAAQSLPAPQPDSSQSAQEDT